MYHVKQKVLSLHGAYSVFNDAGEECYYVKQNAVSITNKTHLYNMQDEEVALIHRKVVSMHATHYIEMSNGEQAVLSEKKLIQLHDNFEIEGFGWHVNGDVWRRSFQITDDAESVIAEAQEKWFTVGDKIAVNIPNEKDVEKVIAVLITLSLIHRDETLAMSTTAADQ